MVICEASQSQSALSGGERQAERDQHVREGTGAEGRKWHSVDPSIPVPGSREKMPRWAVWLAPQGHGRAHLQQREVGQKAGVQLFHIVEQFNQVDVSLAQLVAHQVVLSMALQHLANGGVRSGAQGLAGWTLLLPCPPPIPTSPSAPHWVGGDLRPAAPDT